METPVAQLLEVEKSSSKLYKAKIRIAYKGRAIEVTVPNMTRKPHTLNARIEGDYILVDIHDPEGEGIATCCIHKGHLEKGAGAECRSLLLPP